MADNVVSAATLISAILEHQGFMHQARFLDTFQDFFRDAGALLYLFGGIGAVVSVVLFGSFQAPRYFLLGPAIFWFLVGPTTETEGVLWKLGDGPFRGLLRREGRDAANAARQEILEKLNQRGAGVDSNINVAVGFYLFARPISDFVNEFVGIMLKDESRSDLMVTKKTHALELIAQALPNDTGFVQRLEQGLSASCPRMMHAATAVAWNTVRDRITASFGGGGGGGGNAADLARVRQQALDQVLRMGEIETVPTSGSGFDELIRAHAAAPANSGSALAKRLVKAGTQEPQDFIMCRDAWGLIAEELWHHAGRSIPRILRLATNEADYQRSRDYACRELTLKAVTETQGDICNLRPAVALSILHRHISRGDTFSRVMQRHWNSMEPNNPADHAQLTSANGGNFMEWVTETGQAVYQRGRNLAGQMYNQVFLQRHERVGTAVQTTRMWAPHTSFNVLYGMDDAMWVGTRMHETMRLRGEIYAWALHLPYYQGIILYLVSVAYPFVALIVLLPGRAFHFVNVPLAYLWAKSWDIGFAAVIILDKVMYNLLPSREVSQQLQQGPWRELEKLPQALSEAYNFDPLGSVHTYYAVIAMVWLSVPVLTGAMTLRTRRAILSSFVDGARAQASDGGMTQASAYSISAQNARTMMYREIQGFAKSLPTLGDGVDSGARAMSAETLARIAGGVHGLDKALSSGNWKGNVPDATKGLTEGMQKYLDTQTAIIKAETQLESALLATHDQNLGRWGTLGMMFDAYTSAMDGGGGYEMTDTTANATAELISAFKTKSELAMDTYAQGASALIKAGSISAENFTKRFLTGSPNRLMGPGLFEMALLHQGLEGAAAAGFLEKMVKGNTDGFTNEQYLARVFHLHSSFLDSKDPKKAADDTIGGFKVFAPGITAGGPSYLDTMLSTTGWNRTVVSQDYGSVEAAEAALAKLNSPHRGYTSPGLDYVFGVNGKEHYEQRAADYASLRKSAPDLYELSVEQRRNFILGVYGLNPVQEFFRGKGQNLTEQQITMDHLVQYSEALAKADAAANGALPFYNLDPQGLQIAKGNPLFQGAIIEDWISRRQGIVNYGAVLPQRGTSTLVTSPGDVFPSTWPSSAGRIPKAP